MQFSDIKLIAFDFDGTIAKTTKYAKTFFEKYVGQEIDAKKYFGPPTKVVIANLIKDYKLKISLEDFYKSWNKNYISFVSKKKIITKSTINAIKKLKRDGYILVIITSSSRKKLNILLSKEIEKNLDLIVGSEDYKKGKPNPESLLKLMKKYKIKKSECVYIGDNIVDIYFAKNAGIRGIGKIDFLYGKAELEKAGATATIKTIKDLLKLL
ncbi:MAG: HAD-IIIA family hydrolase [Candidatus ainarchaeum sp.]|nr:HAD-IIIA family hydrolase [Candidatus ainarchaeum sp.]